MSIAAGTIEEGAVTRAVRGALIGTTRAMERAKQQRELEGLAEYEERLTIHVNGQAEEFPSWTEFHINFGITFVDGRGSRDSELVRPHFTYGAEVTVGGPVALHACVTRWDFNSRRETTGCMLSIGCSASDVARKFRGELHAAFQGFGAPAEAYGDLSQYDIE